MWRAPGESRRKSLPGDRRPPWPRPPRWPSAPISRLVQLDPLQRPRRPTGNRPASPPRPPRRSWPEPSGIVADSNRRGRPCLSLRRASIFPQGRIAASPRKSVRGSGARSLRPGGRIRDPLLKGEDAAAGGCVDRGRRERTDGQIKHQEAAQTGVDSAPGKPPIDALEDSGRVGAGVKRGRRRWINLHGMNGEVTEAKIDAGPFDASVLALENDYQAAWQLCQSPRRRNPGQA